jgi:hypothetical protein
LITNSALKKYLASFKDIIYLSRMSHLLSLKTTLTLNAKISIRRL